MGAQSSAQNSDKSPAKASAPQLPEIEPFGRKSDGFHDTGFFRPNQKRFADILCQAELRWVKPENAALRPSPERRPNGTSIGLASTWSMIGLTNIGVYMEILGILSYESFLLRKGNRPF